MTMKRVLEELSVEEIAAALGIPEATVRTLGEAFTFDGERCDRIVARVLERIAAGT
jgi:RNA polymerase sigma-70 factor, ECF subfamily